MRLKTLHVLKLHYVGPRRTTGLWVKKGVLKSSAYCPPTKFDVSYIRIRLHKISHNWSKYFQILTWTNSTNLLCLRSTVESWFYVSESSSELFLLLHIPSSKSKCTSLLWCLCWCILCLFDWISQFNWSSLSDNNSSNLCCSKIVSRS